MHVNGTSENYKVTRVAKKKGKAAEPKKRRKLAPEIEALLQVSPNMTGSEIAARLQCNTTSVYGYLQRRRKGEVKKKPNSFIEHSSAVGRMLGQRSPMEEKFIAMISYIGAERAEQLLREEKARLLQMVANT